MKVQVVLGAVRNGKRSSCTWEAIFNGPGDACSGVLVNTPHVRDDAAHSCHRSAAGERGNGSPSRPGADLHRAEPAVGDRWSSRARPAGRGVGGARRPLSLARRLTVRPTPSSLPLLETAGTLWCCGSGLPGRHSAVGHTGPAAPSVRHAAQSALDSARAARRPWSRGRPGPSVVRPREGEAGSRGRGPVARARKRGRGPRRPRRGASGPAYVSWSPMPRPV